MYSQQQQLQQLLQQQRQLHQQQQDQQFQQQVQQDPYHPMNTYATASAAGATTIPYLPTPTSTVDSTLHTYNSPRQTAAQIATVQPPIPPSHAHAHYPQGYNTLLPTTVPNQPPPNNMDAQPLGIHELAEFASTMVYLMWHAKRPSVMKLHELSKLIQATTTKQQTDDQHISHSKETAKIANQTSGEFKKFCKQILNATQLSESVILLSLKYIAMLLQNSPNIQGAEGSEYRLFTVALMLANKFLDDNTFTNKTWSDVSGMKVTDLNIMEIEFLEVLRFRLFIKQDEFDGWKTGLFEFRSQLNNASQVQQQEKLLEETFKGIQQAQAQAQQAQQQQANQQVSEQQYQFLLMLSKAQLPHYPTQPLDRPLTRVPLRIPMLPVYSNRNDNQVNMIPQQQQQQQPTNYYKQPSPLPLANNNNSINYNMNTVTTTIPSHDQLYLPQQHQQHSTYATPYTSNHNQFSNSGGGSHGNGSGVIGNDNNPYYQSTPENYNPYNTQQSRQTTSTRISPSYYNDPPPARHVDYSIYDMSGGSLSHQQQANDLYSAGNHHYQQQQQPQHNSSNSNSSSSRAIMQQQLQLQPQQPQQQSQPQQYNNNNYTSSNHSNNPASRNYSPQEEDSLTTSESYHNSTL